MRFALLLVTALTACADDLDDRIRAAVARLGAEDPDDRDAGEAELAKLVAEAPDRILGLVDHPDPEVALRIRRVCRNAGIYDPTGEKKRRPEILKTFETRGKPGRERAALLRELLSLGPETVSLIAGELQSGTWVPVPEPARVAAPGSAGAELRIRNPGKTGCWFRPVRNSVIMEWRPLGALPGYEEPIAGWESDDGLTIESYEPNPQLVVRGHLLDLVRVPPGGEAVFVTSEAMPMQCGEYILNVLRLPQTGRAEAAFEGRTIVIPETDPGTLPRAVRVVLGETKSDALSARILRDGDGWSLEITALGDLPAMEEKTSCDNFWWVAQGSDDVRLGSGAMLSTPEERAPLKKGDIRRVPLRASLPETARRLWLGVDHTYRKLQAVAAPVELPEPK